MLSEFFYFGAFAAECANNTNARKIFLCHRREKPFVFVTFLEAVGELIMKYHRYNHKYRHRSKCNKSELHIHRKHKISRKCHRQNDAHDRGHLFGNEILHGINISCGALYQVARLVLREPRIRQALNVREQAVADIFNEPTRCPRFKHTKAVACKHVNESNADNDERNDPNILGDVCDASKRIKQQSHIRRQFRFVTANNSVYGNTNDLRLQGACEG